MERETYSEGKYSQIKLSDNTRFLIEVLNRGFTVRKKQGIGSGELIWSCNIFKKIRGLFSTSPAAKTGLQIILNHLMQAENETQLLDQLAKARSEIVKVLMR